MICCGGGDMDGERTPAPRTESGRGTGPFADEAGVRGGSGLWTLNLATGRGVVLATSMPDPRRCDLAEPLVGGCPPRGWLCLRPSPSDGGADLVRRCLVRP